MGWDTVDTLRGPLFEGIDAQTYVYYVHSYAPRLCDAAIAATVATACGSARHSHATTSSARSSTPKRAGRRAAGFYATS